MLLRSGYADDAHARWRSLHEIAVISYYIQKEGQETASRYLRHGRVQQYKLACAQNKHKDRISAETLTHEEFLRLEKEYETLLVEYGESFKGDYGWASRPKERNLTAIEKYVELDHMRPYYKMASDNTHAGSHGAHFRLGLALEPDAGKILAGPSNLGLADPGHAAAVSMNQVTEALLKTKWDVECEVIREVLFNIAYRVGRAFLQVHQTLEKQKAKNS